MIIKPYFIPYTFFLIHFFFFFLDTKLNKNGREQAESVGRRLRKLRFDHIYTSDLTRAKKVSKNIIVFGCRDTNDVILMNFFFLDSRSYR
jgi:hypothetical protein